MTRQDEITVFSTTVRVGAEAELRGWWIVKNRYGRYGIMTAHMERVGSDERPVEDTEREVSPSWYGDFGSALAVLTRAMTKTVEQLAELYTT